jgi:hypothetical protein
VSLLDLLPVVSAVFADAPARIREALLTAFDIQVLYRSDMHQVTIRAALTDDTLGPSPPCSPTPAPTATPPAPPQAKPGLPFSTCPYGGSFDTQ